MERLTLEKAKQLAAEAVAERGEDYVYTYPNGTRAGTPEAHGNACLYVHGTQPGCLVGEILHRHGVPLDSLLPFEKDIAYELPTNWFEGWRVREFMHAVQTRQDCGATWGWVVREASLAIQAYENGE